MALQLRFLNVGYGEATLLRCPDPSRPDGEFVMLIDGGSAEAEEYDGYAYRRRCTEHLAAAGVTRIDMLINTHIHEDHTSGLVEVVERLPIGAFGCGILPDASWDMLPEEVATSPGTLKFLHSLNDAVRIRQTLSKNGTPMEILRYEAAPRQLAPGLEAEILAPEASFAADYQARLAALYAERDLGLARQKLIALDAAMNNVGAVLRLSYGGVNILLPGDLNRDGYGPLFRHPETLRADVFKLGHHGQKDSITIPILDAVSPRVAAICASSDRRYDSINPVTLTMLDDWGREHGAPISVLISDLPKLPPWTDGAVPAYMCGVTVTEQGVLTVDRA